MSASGADTPAACSDMKTSYTSKSDASRAVFSELVSCGRSPDVSVGALQLLCDILKCPPVRSDEPNKRRWFLDCLSRASPPVLATDRRHSSSDLFNAIEKMRRSELHDCVRAHGLSFTRQTTVDKLKQLVIDHVANGACAHTAAGLLGAPACHAVNIRVSARPSASE